MPGQNPKAAVSFDDIIQADRNRRKNEALANEIFGRNKANNNALNNSSKPSSRTPDLASRVTKATKRSSSVASTGSPRSNAFTPPSRPASTINRNARQNRVAKALNSQEVNIVSSSTPSKDLGLSIKGKAGPFAVEASNFARGTTVADIESSLQHEFLDSSGGNGLISCQLTQTTPYVVAEMVFTEKLIADRIISTYDKQKADGRILHLKLKPVASIRVSSSPTKPIELITSDTLPSDPVALTTNDDAMEDVEADVAPLNNSKSFEEQERAIARGADVNVKDDRYDFEDDKSSRRTDEPRRDRERDRDYERDRDGDGHRDRERNRDRDRERERERYDSRDRPSTYRQDARPSSYNSRASHYGNGVGNVSGPAFPGPGRGAYGGYRGGPGGGGFGPDTIRGGGGFGRRGDLPGTGGGYAGGYRRGY
ncbi:hypothetical protein PV10_06239 [Exophiala mesophila]|uniref:RRM domain-containing protein n=1 Tax=Exophiala mesophila TaxID=212818 RepID=A0A0D1WRG5_EXOME|nr:uncharacterized protein PV10_06239 [Exophiala mesophila]KIV91730.1 hypothetical protein PV10_06239 [Exophiala mesophila]